MTLTITRDMPTLPVEEYLKRIEPFSTKLAYFMQHGYEPHYYQTLFHTAVNPQTGRLARYRSLAAGRRGGKTLSAAEEVSYYLEFPSEFHKHVHGREDDRALWAYALTENYKRLVPAMWTFRDVLLERGLRFGKGQGKDVQWKVGDKLFEFANGSIIEFRSADDPESLRGAGLDMLWMDEAAFIKSPRAYEVVRPALGDKQGIVLNTTTPDFKNWFYQKFWEGKALDHPGHFRVSYWSLDNPHYPEEEWLEEKDSIHPMLFAVEYMASFDAMKGKALSPEWLHYYEADELPKGLIFYIGVDPAISLNENADEFVISCVGVDSTTGLVYLVDQYAGRIPFPDQIDKINEWYMRFSIHPNGRLSHIGVENVAYQAALAQQAIRLDNSIPIMDIEAKGKKFERIMGMSPFFKAERILIRKTHKDFITEWINYDPSLKKPKDDCLDSVEIALRTAGVLLSPQAVASPPAEDMTDLLPKSLSSQQAANARFRRLGTRTRSTAEAEFDSSLL